MMEGHELTMKILRNPDDRTLGHFPDENGDAYCDTDEELVEETHKVSNASIWCAQCLQRMLADNGDDNVG